MHYVNLGNKSKQTLIRFLIYGLVGIVISVLTILLVYIVQGYGIDRKTGQLIQNGLILVDSAPDGATVTLNGRAEGKVTPARLPVPAGDYDVNLALSGYRNWSRSFDLQGSEVIWLDYPIFVPEKIDTASMGGLPNLSFAELSANKKYIIAAQKNNKSELTLIELDGSKDTKTKTVTLPDSILTRVKDKLGSFEFVAWGPNNKHILFRHLNDTVSEYIWVDVTKPETAINVSKQFSTAFEDMRFARDTDQLFGIDKGNLRHINLDDKTLGPILASNVIEIQKAKDNLFYFVSQESKDADYSLAQLDNDEVRQLTSSKQKLSHIDFAEYDSSMYLAVRRGDNDIVLFRNISPDDPSKNVPEKVINMREASDLEFSERGRFLMVRAGTAVRVYDIELKRDYAYGLPEDEGAQYLNWIDEHHLTFTQDGKAVLMDFDGSNRYEIAAVDPRFPINIDTKKTRIYSVGLANKQTALQRTELLIPK